MGNDFRELFDEWSHTYDDAVAGQDSEYAAVFARYEEILKETASRAFGTVVEYGVGTGNLTKFLLHHADRLLGIEPSNGMRAVAKKKHPDVEILPGDFFTIPKMAGPIHCIVSTYAFHHLTDDEKEKAIGLYASILPKGGKIIFADTIFSSEEEKRKMIVEAKRKNFWRLAKDLETEFYSTIPTITAMLEKHHCEVEWEPKNEFVWIMEAIKKGD